MGADAVSYCLCFYLLLLLEFNLYHRHTIREPAAEFIGTMILVMFGTAGNAQGTLFNDPNVSSSQAGVSLSILSSLALHIATVAYGYGSSCYILYGIWS